MMMNKRTFLWVLLAPVIFMLPSCKDGDDHTMAAAINADSVKMEIAAKEAAYAVAQNAKNVDGILVYYANDASSLANNEPTRVGMDAIKAGLIKDMAEDTSGNTISFEVTGVWAGGQYATETGTSTTKDKEGKVVRTGKYMTLFELRDGKYTAIRDIWNSDAK